MSNIAESQANSSYSSEVGGVQSTLAKMSLPASIKSYITSNKSMWENFGKMTSHIYRKKLMDKMDQANMSKEARLMVFFFFSVIKNQPRVIQTLKDMPEADKNQTWYTEVYSFINNQICQYVTQARTSGKFPAVNIPTCNPGLDILFFTLMVKDSEKNIDILKNRTTFSQLRLNSEMQTTAKSGYDYYWNTIVQGTKNQDNKGPNAEEPKSREEYYNTGAKDSYLLLDDTLKEIQAPDGGYTRANIESYLIKRSI